MNLATIPATVADFAAQRPKSIKVFQQHGIDFCCGGKRPLEAACAEAGVALDTLVREIEAAEQGPGAARQWQEEPLPALIDHIITRYHRPLDGELPRLRAMVQRVLEVHGERDPERLQAIAKTFAVMEAEIWPHMRKEEAILFPWIRGGNGPDAGAPIRVMQHEHDVLGDLLKKMRELTRDYTPPLDACATWRGLYQGLHDLEVDLHEHIHLENNVLFPRALAGQ
jgi:regulator of cell morphogenesis and NO signaling